MPQNKLSEFFREKQAKATPTDIDWAAKREGWIRAVGKLYDTIVNEYLGLADIADIVEVAREMKTVREAYIGTYAIDEMTLSVGDELVIFSPKGVNVVGAAGRVDVRGDRGEAILVRQAGDQWSLVVSRTPTVRLVPLTDESFLEMLRSVMR